MFKRVMNRLRWQATGVEPKRESRPMTLAEAHDLVEAIHHDLAATDPAEADAFREDELELIDHLTHVHHANLPLNY